MSKPTTNERMLQIKRRKAARLVALLMEGKSQKEAAKMIGLSEQSVCSWLKNMPELKDQVDAVLKGEMNNPFRNDDKLSAFMAWLQVHEPRKFKYILSSYDYYINGKQ